MRRRPDQFPGDTPPALGAGSRSSVVRARLVVIAGANDGEFVYNATGTQLLSANVGAVTTDPLLGITCQQGFSTFNGFGVVINLLSTSKGAFFQYQDLGTSSQGALILAVASTSSTDPVNGTSYGPGLKGINPAFGNTLTVLGDAINFGRVGFTLTGLVDSGSGSGAARSFIHVAAPEQGQAGHAVLRVFGKSPDGTVPGGVIMSLTDPPVPATSELLEVQGNIAAALVKAVVSGAEETWHAASLAAGFSAGSPAPRFQLEPVNGGRVRLAGIVNLTATEAAGVTIFTLPAGYLPAQFHSFVTSNTLSGYTLGARAIQVNATGQVQLGSSGVNTNFVVLDGICFELD